MIMNDSQVSKVKVAYNRASKWYDDLQRGNKIANWGRRVVRAHVLQFLHEGSKILEINAGTGADAIFFASRGFSVHATAISGGMLKYLDENVKKRHLEGLISSQE